MHTFWRYGYERTSYPVLEKAMSMNRGSIYAAFGDKQQLFLEALDHYIDQRNIRMEQGLRDESVPLRARLRDHLHQLIQFSLDQGAYCGCMLVNSAIELGPFDDVLSERVWTSFRTSEDVLKRHIEQAQAKGEVGIDKDPAALASVLVNTIIGMRVTLRFRPEADRPRRIVDQVLKLLD